jgi:hypothetical protein
MFKVCTKSLGFLRAKKNIKIVCSLLFSVRWLSVRWEKSKVQTPYALKNAKLVWFSTKDYILRFYSFI